MLSVNRPWRHLTFLARFIKTARLPAVADHSDHTTSKAALELQEPTVTMVSQTAELIINIPNVPTENQYSANLFDAMDKVVNHKDLLNLLIGWNFVIVSIWSLAVWVN